MLASRGYPESSSKGQVITGIDDVSRKQNHFVFHSSTAISSKGNVITNGTSKRNKRNLTKYSKTNSL